MPILPDDTAAEVFAKVTVAAEMSLDAALPALHRRNGAAMAERSSPQGSYFGGRRPEDGRIDWSLAATRIHNLRARGRATVSGRTRDRRWPARAHPAQRVLDAASAPDEPCWPRAARCAMAPRMPHRD